MEWYIGVWKKFADFSGRARRKEYWMFVLFNIIVSIVLAIIDGVTGLTKSTGGVGPLGGLYSLAVLVPSIAVAIRRLHDTGKSGLYFLVVFVPCIGPIILLVWMIQDSVPGSNEYGPNPKGQ